MSAFSTLIVRVAASLLPPESRDRYREQWLADLRDAPELGIGTGEIAAGSMAFAMAHGRVLPNLGSTRGWTVTARARLAVGLSLSVAVLAIIQVSTLSAGGFVGNTAYDFITFTASMLLLAFGIVAPLLALILAFATAGITRRIRLSVALLVTASTAAIFSGAHGIQFWWMSVLGPVTPGSLIYPLAIVLVAVACRVAWRELRPAEQAPSRRIRPKLLLASVAGGLLVAAAAIVGFLHATALWDARTPLVFELPFTESNRAFFEDWMTLKVQFESQVTTVLGLWIVIGVVSAVTVALFGLSRWATIRRVMALSFGALSLVLLSYGSILVFLNLGSSDVAVTQPVELWMLVARWTLVALIVLVVGGERNTMKARRQLQSARP
ncbi:MAG: hypothetical protein ACSHW9_05785 [Salinibacterium amurskyense]